MCVCANTHGMCCYHVGPRDCTQIVRLGDKHLYLMYHLNTDAFILIERIRPGKGNGQINKVISQGDGRGIIAWKEATIEMESKQGAPFGGFCGMVV